MNPIPNPDKGPYIYGVGGTPKKPVPKPEPKPDSKGKPTPKPLDTQPPFTEPPPSQVG